MLICGGEYRTPNKCHAPEYLVFSNRTVDGEQEQYEEVTLHIGKHNVSQYSSLSYCM